MLQSPKHNSPKHAKIELKRITARGRPLNGTKDSLARSEFARVAELARALFQITRMASVDFMDI